MTLLRNENMASQKVCINICKSPVDPCLIKRIQLDSQRAERPTLCLRSLSGLSSVCYKTILIAWGRFCYGPWL